jgi:hypothetical protein
MAYPTIDKPYGLKPINLIGGQVFAGATRQIAITTGSVNYNTAIYNGAVVQLDTSGCVINSTLENQATASSIPGVLGVFLGCRYTNPTTKQPTYSQYWPGFASGVTDAFAYISDDPDALYQVASVGATADTTGLDITPVQQTALGTNVVLVLNAANTTYGNAQTGIYYNNVTTALPFRIVDLVPDTSYVSSGNIVYPEVIVKFNFGYHSYYQAVGK